MDKKQFLKKFNQFMKLERHLSANTVSSYQSDLKFFFEYLDKKKLSFTQVTPKHMIAFFIYQQNISKHSVRSLSRYRTSIRLLYNFALIHQLVDENPLEHVRTPKFQIHSPSSLSINEVNQIINCTNESNPKELRNKTIFEMLYSTGIRISELTNLTIYSLHLNEKLILVQGKGKKERLVPFGKRLERLLNNYLRYGRPQLMQQKLHAYLFVNKTEGKAISRKGIWKIIHEYGYRLGIDKNVSPHMFRHSFATHLLQNGADIRSIQELLGHESITTTQMYTHRTQKELKQIHQNFHPHNHE